MDIKYLTADQVVALHDEAIAQFGGAPGVRSGHLVASAVYQPMQSAFGEDAYPTVAEKAAAYGYFLAESQPFIDGNKRTAAATMLVFLDINGYDFDQSDDEIAKMIEDLGRRVVDQGEFFGWVVNHAHCRPPSNVVPTSAAT